MGATTTTVPAIATHGVAVHFGGVRAVDSVDIAVAQGETRAVIGPNGAGKTTLFNLISGHLQPTHGTVELFGEDVTTTPTHVRSRNGVSRTFQLSNLFGQLSLRENVELAVMGNDAAARRRFQGSASSAPGVADATGEILARFGLDSLAQERVDALAYGQQRVLEIAMAVAGDPRILLLDEPTAGVSRGEAEYLTQVISELDPNLTVMLVEHDMAVAFALADQVTVMDDGRELLTAPPNEVRGNPQVIEAYLGGGQDVA